MCSLDAAQPFATVRNRSQPFARGRYGVPVVSSAKRITFKRQTSRCFVSRGRRGTPRHSDVFGTASKVVPCGRRKTLATFSEDVL